MQASARAFIMRAANGLRGLIDMHFVHPAGMSSRAFWIGFGLISVLGTVLRFWNLGETALWMDEAITVAFARLPLDVIMFDSIDNHPPLIYMIEHFWISVFPDPSLYRVPFATAGALAVILVMLMGRDFGLPFMGLAAGLLLALSAGQVYYSQEARQYVFVVLGSVIAAWGAVGMADEDRQGRIFYPVLYVLGGTIAIYSQLIGLIAMAILGFGALAAMSMFAKPWGAMRVWLVTNIVLFVLTLPWLLAIPAAMGTFPGLPYRVPLTDIQWVLRTAVGYPGLGAINLLQLLADAFLFGAAFAGAILAWRHERKSLALAIAGMALFYPVIITLLHMLSPIAHVRMFVPVSLGLVLGAGYTIAAVRDLRIKAGILCLFAAFGTGSAITELVHHAKQEDYKAAFEYADANGFATAPVLTCYDYSAAAAWEARPDAEIYGVFADATIRYPGPQFWRTVEMSMTEYRNASTKAKDTFLGGGLIVEGGVEAALADASRVALFHTSCPDNLVTTIHSRLSDMGFEAGDETLIMGKAANYTIIEPTLLKATLFERTEPQLVNNQDE